LWSLSKTVLQKGQYRQELFRKNISQKAPGFSFSGIFIPYIPDYGLLNISDIPPWSQQVSHNPAVTL